MRVTTMTPSTVLIAMLVFVVAACGGTGSDGDAVPASTAEAAEETTEPETGEAEPEPEPEPEPEETATQSDPPAPTHPLHVAATSTADAGPRPLLGWETVDGAANYRVVVLDADGTPYWTWTGSDTTVHVGNDEDPSVPGARVFEPMTWTVAALDGEGVPLAISEPSPLVP